MHTAAVAVCTSILVQAGSQNGKVASMIHILQDCKPLLLKGPGGLTWEFQGVEGIVKGRIDAAAALCPPDAVGLGTRLCPHNFCHERLLFNSCHTYQGIDPSARMMSKHLRSYFHTHCKRHIFRKGHRGEESFHLACCDSGGSTLSCHARANPCANPCRLSHRHGAVSCSAGQPGVAAGAFRGLPILRFRAPLGRRAVAPGDPQPLPQDPGEPLCHAFQPSEDLDVPEQAE